MKNIHKPILDIMFHYASQLENDDVLNILEKKSIESKTEAECILQFLDNLCEKIAEDSINKIVILNQPIHTTDAEKVCNIIEDYIEELGYGDLLD